MGKKYDELSKKEKKEFINNNSFIIDRLVDVADQPRTRTGFKKAFARHLYYILNKK